MQRHPYFDLWLHGDGALADLLGSAVQTRETIHEWPLSCVQRLVLADGRTLIYKSQTGPTVEAAFYRRAQSPLLVDARILAEHNGHAQMVLPYIDAPLLEDLNLSEDDVVRIGRDLVAQMGAITGDDLPVLVDIGTLDAWRQVIQTMCGDLRALVAEGAFEQVRASDIDAVALWAESEPILVALGDETAIVHEDFTADNIFQTPDGFRVIDWQRVIKGPSGVALALLLESLDFDPLPHTGPGIVAIMLLLRMRHFTSSARTWFPPGIPTYDEQIAALVERLRDLVG